MRRASRSPRRLLGVCACLLALLVSTCDDTTAPTTGTVITSGFSFGECLGFCYQEITCAGVNARYVKRDYRNGETVEGDVKIEIQQWQELVATVDLQALIALPDVIGCPDCADGGAEWVDVARDGVRKRVTFEFGDAIPSVQPFLDAVRAQRTAILSPH